MLVLHLKPKVLLLQLYFLLGLGTAPCLEGRGGGPESFDLSRGRILRMSTCGTVVQELNTRLIMWGVGAVPVRVLGKGSGGCEGWGL